MHRRVLSPEQQESRAKNAVAEFLFRELIVPKVFFDARWSGKSYRVDFTLRPERFKLDPAYFKRIDKFTAACPADLEVRA